MIGKTISKMKVNNYFDFFFLSSFPLSFFLQNPTPGPQSMMGILSRDLLKRVPFDDLLCHLCKSTAEAAFADIYQFYMVQGNVSS